MKYLRRSLWGLTLLLTGIVALTLGSLPAQAKSKYSALIIDAESGRVLHSNHADSQRYPASLTKMMTLYMTFEALEKGNFSKDTRLKVSRYAANRRPSRLGLKVGSKIRVEDAILALVTKSANDVAAVLAEALGGTEAQFGRMMTRKARDIGMSRTVFRNASGLPNRKQVTTARDMATLGRRLFRDFPQYYHYFSTESFTYQGRNMGNHNNLLGVYDGVDGIKTGYINASGFNLVSSVRRNGYHLIGVVFGGKTARRRDAQMIKILDAAFKRLPVRATPQRLAATDLPRPTYKPAVPSVRPPPRVIATLPRSKPGLASLAQTTVIAPKSLDPIASLIAAQTTALTTAQTTGQTTGQARGQASLAAVPIPRPAPRAIRSASSASTTGISGPEGSRAAADWGIQVGAFSEITSARTHMLDLIVSYPDILSKAETAVLPYQTGGQTLFRARLEGFAEAQARGACKTLVAQGSTCVPVPPGSLFGQISG